MNAIILCGGLATRLRDITEDKIPKCLVDINGTPFIKYQLDWLDSIKGYKFDRVILALGRLHEQVIEYVQTIEHLYHFKIFYSIELKALGTGGAMKHAFRFVNDVPGNKVIIMNGDVINRIPLENLINATFNNKNLGEGKFLMSLVEVNDTDRFGIVKLTSTLAIREWKPKQYVYNALANRGVYCYTCNGVNPFKDYPAIFSFENDYVANHVHDMDDVMYGLSQDGYFIDIGIPSDYKKFCDSLS